MKEFPLETGTLLQRAFWSCFSCFLYFALLFWNHTFKKANETMKVHFKLCTYLNSCFVKFSASSKLFPAIYIWIVWFSECCFQFVQLFLQLKYADKTNKKAHNYAKHFWKEIFTCVKVVRCLRLAGAGQVMWDPCGSWKIFIFLKALSPGNNKFKKHYWRCYQLPSLTVLLDKQSEWKSMESKLFRFRSTVSIFLLSCCTDPFFWLLHSAPFLFLSCYWT